MPTPINPRGRDNHSSYFIPNMDQNAEPEIARLWSQNALLNTGFGGPLPDQSETAQFGKILDIGCGPGAWLFDMAAQYKTAFLVGVDKSWHMIEFAKLYAQTKSLANQIEFHVMDVLEGISYPENTFDLTTTRLSSSFVNVRQWPGFISEMVRVTRPGGVIRIVEDEVPISSSKALMLLNGMATHALFQDGKIFARDRTNLVFQIPFLLQNTGIQVQTQEVLLEIVGGTEMGHVFQQDMAYVYKMLPDYLKRHGAIPLGIDYNEVYQQALLDLQQPETRTTWQFITAWGQKTQ